MEDPHASAPTPSTTSSDFQPSAALADVLSVVPSEDEQSDGLAGLDLTNAVPPVKSLITCTIEGIIEPSDMAALLQSRRDNPKGVTPGDLKVIRERHHAVARHAASGMSNSMICSITGYTEVYLSNLLNSPAMQELVSYYRTSYTAASEVIGHRLRMVAMDAVESLEEDLASNALKPADKIQLAKLGLDRSGHGPSSTQHQVSEHHLIDHAELQRLNREARRESQGDIVDVVGQDVLALPLDEPRK